MKDVKNGSYRFADVEIDVQNLRLKVGPEIRPLEPKSFRLLLFLARNRGRAIPKDEILTAVWADTFVSDNSLAKAVTQVRKALDDDPKAPRFIETVPSVGYRFVAEVTENVGEVTVTAEPQPDPPAAPTAVALPTAPRSRRFWLWAAVAVTVLLLVNATVWFIKLRTAPLPPQKLVAVTTYAGSERYPSFSPDGRQVAFYWDGEKGVDPGIYVKMLGDTNALRLTSGRDAVPAWSPDGRRIAFVRAASVETFTDSSNSPGQGIYMVSAMGGAERKLLDIGTYDQISWSPDGKWLALARREPGDPSRAPGQDSARSLCCQRREANPAAFPTREKRLTWPRRFPRRGSDLPGRNAIASTNIPAIFTSRNWGRMPSRPAVRARSRARR